MAERLPIYDIETGLVTTLRATRRLIVSALTGSGKSTQVPQKLLQLGLPGRGLSVEMSVKHGPVTLLSVVQTVDGRLELLVAEGESVPGPILEIGNTNSRYRFSIGVRRFVNEWNVRGPAHHCAVGVGHIAQKIEKLGALLNLQVQRVC